MNLRTSWHRWRSGRGSTSRLLAGLELDEVVAALRGPVGLRWLDDCAGVAECPDGLGAGRPVVWRDRRGVRHLGTVTRLDGGGLRVEGGGQTWFELVLHPGGVGTIASWTATPPGAPARRRRRTRVDELRRLAVAAHLLRDGVRPLPPGG